MGFAAYILGALPFAAMMMVECTDVGLSVICKAALTKGMSNFVSVFYINALATLLLFPFFIFNRNKRPPLTFNLLSRCFLLALIGSSGQIIYLTAIRLSSPTLSSAITNLIPIFTFLLAVIFRMEKLDFRKPSSQAKSLGAIVAVIGAIVVTLYKGPVVLGVSSTIKLTNQLHMSQQLAWIIGGFLLLLVALMSATWIVFQADNVKEYPDKTTIVFFFTFFISIQSAVFSLIKERSLSAWKLRHHIEFIAIISQALLGSIFRIMVHTWCLHKQGPVYVAMFKPMGIAIAVILSFLFLGDALHIGSVIGSVVLALGFYTVMWGQMKEKKMGLQNNVESLEACNQRTPLL